MRIFALILLLGSILTASAFQTPTTVYRYEWVITGSNAPTPLGQQFSGYIDFSLATGSGTDQSPIFDLQWTSSASNTNGGPFIPAFSFSGSDIAFCGSVGWNNQQITFLSLNLTNVSTTINGVLSDSSSQTGLPTMYTPDEITQGGKWMFEGTASVPEPGSGKILLMLLVGACAVTRFAKRKSKFAKLLLKV